MVFCSNGQTDNENKYRFRNRRMHIWTLNLGGTAKQWENKSIFSKQTVSTRQKYGGWGIET